MLPLKLQLEGNFGLNLSMLGIVVPTGTCLKMAITHSGMPIAQKLENGYLKKSLIVSVSFFYCPSSLKVLGQNAVKKTCREDENCRKKRENVVRRWKMS